MNQSATINHAQLKKINGQSFDVLSELIRPHGLYASNMSRWNGSYHHYFGRDTAITAILIYEAEKISGENRLSDRMLRALLMIAKFQGKVNNPANGEEVGKIPHEIVTAEKQIDQMASYWQIYGGNPWYIDPDDKHIKNWDSVDSTPLWLVAISNFWQQGYVLPEQAIEAYIRAIKWCLDNQKKYDGFLGWTPTENQSGRIYGGLHNQTWKDSFWAFTYESGGMPVYPLHDVYSNGALWLALNQASVLLDKYDFHLAKKAKKAAKELKKKFNNQSHGFRTKDFYSEALDAQLNKLACPSIDVGMVLAFGLNNRCLIQNKYLNKVVKKLLSSEFLDNNLGVRTYSKNILSYNPKDVYHRGPNVFWPFTNAIFAVGLNKFGYKNEADKVLNAMFVGLNNFDSFVELYQLQDNKPVLWKNSYSKQTSTLNQAWTAAGVYYATNRLLSE